MGNYEFANFKENSFNNFITSISINDKIIVNLDKYSFVYPWSHAYGKYYLKIYQ